MSGADDDLGTTLVVYLTWRAVTPAVEAAIRQVIPGDVVDAAGDVRPLVQRRADPARAQQDARLIDATAASERVERYIRAAAYTGAGDLSLEPAVAAAETFVRATFPDCTREEDSPRLISTADIGTAWATVWYVGGMNSVGVLVDKGSRLTVLRLRGEMTLEGVG